MSTNLERYKSDLALLITKGGSLALALQYEQSEDARRQVAKQIEPDKLKEAIAKLPVFSKDYQSWYSQSKSLIRQVLPDRLEDFVRHYEKPKARKEINVENYCIEDCLQGITANNGGIRQAGPEAGIPRMEQQLAILRSVDARFTSSLFDIKQLVQADVFDSELEAGEELAKKGFLRAAGALVGVVLERHLGQACENHNLKIAKRNPNIADFNDALKESGVVEMPQWRSIQHLGDLRNLCSHSKSAEPTAEQIQELLDGIKKTIKTLF